MSETVIAFRCNDFVIMAASGLNAFYYIKVTDHEDKITVLDSHKMVACSGENGPRVNFTEYIKANIKLNSMRQHGRQSSTPATAAFMRQALARALRSREGLYAVNSLLGGYDRPASEHDDSPPGAHLYYMDYLGTLQAVPFGAHGYGATFVVSILDQQWRPDLTPQEGLDLMQRCCDEVRRRIVVSHSNFICKVATASGVEVVPTVH
jgi:20S proteasome subunit beta 4